MKKYLFFLAAFFFINLIVNIANIWEDTSILSGIYLAPEFIVILLTLTITDKIFPHKNTFLYFFASTIIIFISLSKISFYAVPKFFHRSFNFYIDFAYIPNLLHFVYNSIPLWKFTIVSIAALCLIGLFYWLLYISFRTCTTQTTNYCKEAYIIFLILFITHLCGLHLFHPSCAKEIKKQITFIYQKKHYQQQYQFLLQDAVNKSTNASYNLQKLHKNNVLLFIVESYGETIFSKSRHFKLIQPQLNSFQAILDKHKYNVCSNFIISPTFGGNSWLAHGALSCGVKTFNQIIFDMLLDSDVATMARYFNRVGYRTISVMPGTTKPWPAGKFFGFDKKYYSWNLNYQGPKYGWCTMTDQYVIDYIHRQEINNAKKPLFVEYVLISSHAPFHIQPPYIENWNDLQDGSIYNNKPKITYPIVWPNLSNATEGYVRSISYVLKSIEDYLVQKINDDSLIIILGDHQPHGTITGKKPSWAVPIHIISRNPKLLEPFYKQGYKKGLIPLKNPPYKGMENFLYPFLQNFSE
ncbi:sulfatase-like hydrolase/transferase [Candidatus Uabimicrobium sp. HlEnr_7]|uniref:sulfatase-like hydrolase/transferase n=1 Tax=Candidatus Uabimicrobium helgolandensis TaxID=3095367 RepID=UPI0035563299